jgi:hypothetical protein
MRFLVAAAALAAAVQASPAPRERRQTGSPSLLTDLNVISSHWGTNLALC